MPQLCSSVLGSAVRARVARGAPRAGTLPLHPAVWGPSTHRCKREPDTCKDDPVKAQTAEGRVEGTDSRELRQEMAQVAPSATWAFPLTATGHLPRLSAAGAAARRVRR